MPGKEIELTLPTALEDNSSHVWPGYRPGLLTGTALTALAATLLARRTLNRLTSS